ncbi:MAG TPA: peptide chain release factor N(5)-glutamine methyltransferase [Dehalococcoidia bacterium]|nr:peptide chain release factor N(5)-glutamine methyltransferase [Dehalococcoidia bacterium]
MTLQQALGRAREILAANSVEEASLEGELLLRHALKIDRVQLYLDLGRELTPEEEEAFWHLVERRCQGEPTAYIIGHREFYGLDFYVDPRVLIPRPESELLVEKALELAGTHRIATIADIGTGCGAIAISLARNLPRAKIYATDISASALEVARINCVNHGVADRICLLAGDMLEPLPEPVDLIIANLPYIRQSELPQSGPVSFEPKIALDGGPAGLEKILKLCRKAGAKLTSRGCLLLEIGQGQGEAVTALLRHLFPSGLVEVTPDLSGIERVVSLCLTPNRLGARLAEGA